MREPTWNIFFVDGTGGFGREHSRLSLNISRHRHWEKGAGETEEGGSTAVLRFSFSLSGVPLPHGAL